MYFYVIIKQIYHERNNPMKKSFKYQILSILCIVTLVLSLSPLRAAPKVFAASKMPSLNCSELTLFVNDGYTGGYTYDQANLQIANATKKAKWSSSDKSIATVSDHGYVHALKKGKCTITCKIGNTKLECIVTVLTYKKSDDFGKKIKTSYKMYEKYAKVTVKNPYSYPITTHLRINVYNSNGKKIHDDYEESVIAAKSSTILYIDLSDCTEKISYMECTPENNTPVAIYYEVPISNKIDYTYEITSNGTDRFRYKIFVQNNTDFKLHITGETYVQYKGVTYRNAKAGIVIDPGETNFDWYDISKYDLEQIEPGLVDINEEFIKDNCKLIISNLTVQTITPNND